MLLADAKDYLDVESETKDSGTVEYTVGTNGEAEAGHGLFQRRRTGKMIM